MKIREKVKILLITSLLLLQGCDFEFTPSVIPTIGFQMPATQYQPGYTPTYTPEMVELVEEIDRLFDPFLSTIPEEIDYDKSVYKELDEALAEAYRNCGHDLGTLAYTSTDNPMTEMNFLDCISTVEVEDPDPFSTRKYSVLDWMYKRIISGAENQYYFLFMKRIKVNTANRLNLEPNYLHSLMEANKDVLDNLKEEIIARLLDLNSNDPVQALHFLETYNLGTLGTE